MIQKLPAAAVLFTALLGITLSASAQQSPGGRPTAPATLAPAPARTATGRITGTVTDAATGKPVSYATVAVLDGATGSVVNGGVCGDDGKFVLPGIPAGSYTVQVSFLGYKNEERTGVLVSAGSPTDLGPITLAASAQKLGEVVVTGQKAIIEERVDRTVYNAENDQTTRGGDATDVLKRVPLLSVDLDGNVSLRGSSNIKVLINNKPSTIAASSIADALKQIPADQIKTVEVITSPSAKYDAEGSGGIINIITKTNNLRGATLGLDLSAGLRSTNLGLNGSLRTGKMGFSLGGFGRGSYNVPGEFSNVQTTRSLSGGTPVTTIQSADTRLQQIFGRYTLGWDYDLNKFNSLQASVSYGTRNSRNYQDGLTSATYLGLTPTGTPLSSSQRDVAVKDVSGTVDASLNYTHSFEKPQHEFSILTLFSRNDRSNTFTNNIFNATLGSPSRIMNDNPSYNAEYTIQLDYQNPISKTQILEMGVKDILRRVNSDYSTAYFGAGGESLSAPSILSANNVFTYRQNVTAGYTAYTLSLPKGITVKPGLRYEYTTIDANFANFAAANIPNYGVLVPSLNLSRRLANSNVLKLAYNRRIQRPSLQFLNPNLNASNPKNVSQGNPYLSPEYTNNYELGYSTAIKRLNLNFSSFIRNTTGSIEALRTVRGVDTVSTTYANIGQQNAYGGSVFANMSSGKFNLNAGTDFYYTTLTNNVPDRNFNAANEGWVMSGRVGGSYNFTPVWGVQAFAFYRGRQVQLQGNQSGQGFYTVGVKRDFAEKRGSLGFGFDNFFTPSITVRNTVVSPLIDQASSNVLHTLGFRVSLNYRIGKLTVAPPRRGKSINNDDLKGEGGGGGDAGAGGVTPAAGGGGAAPAGGGGQRPAGMPGTRPAGAPGVRPTGAPAGATPTAAPGAQPATATDSTTTDATKTLPGTIPGQARPTAQPQDSTQRRPASLPTAPANPINAPANAPSPGTTTPAGTTPAGSPGGRP
ncbi:TonB-dependent receptor [Hymenobacter sp. BT770]|uniref:TonB-dependent receptor domain-containing protein n=1 Tax=Hymenobacter sp. BT770 TaxID=2886942 RepID=UPI001D10C08C|nr:TonB-dependent receptor [Hymenobacter sp. BT770]MCC3154422.1 TonB-dependent receptor [Hymenobacter sp. BT770]MDO3416293.1 TonB-dependent receptor [Hymenobacter sp. BT770]